MGTVRAGMDGGSTMTFARASFLGSVMRALRAAPLPRETDASRCDIYFEEVGLRGAGDPVRGAYLMPLVTLRTVACRWARASGCVMCGYHLGALHRRPSDLELLVQTEDAIRRLDPRIYPAILFTSNGSFLDPVEIPDPLRPRLCRRLRDAGFRFLVTETRAEFVTPERVEAMADAFAPDAAPARRPLSFSFGFESADDHIRAHAVNKGVTTAELERAWRVVLDAGCSIDAYVLLGKPFLTAQEDVADAICAIRHAVDRGVGYVFVMVANRTRFSLIDHLMGQGRYRLPSLWRAFELFNGLPREYWDHVQVKAFSHAPVEPETYAGTCPRCSDSVKSALNHWNQTGDSQHLFRVPDCDCRATFRRDEWSVTADDLDSRLRREWCLLVQELNLPEPIGAEPRA